MTVNRIASIGLAVALNRQRARATAEHARRAGATPRQ
jgi:hypothetical protein